jgi:SAM-dependent methyltransferase
MGALQDSSIGTVVTANAWHWFASEASAKEILRVLAPGGHLGIIFNTQARDNPSELQKRLYQCVGPYIKAAAHPGNDSINIDRVKLPIVATAEQWEPPAELTSFRQLGPDKDRFMTADHLIGFVHSASVFAGADEATREKVATELRSMLADPAIPRTHDAAGRELFELSLVLDLHYIQKRRPAA